MLCNEAKVWYAEIWSWYKYAAAAVGGREIGDGKILLGKLWMDEIADDGATTNDDLDASEIVPVVILRLGVTRK